MKEIILGQNTVKAILGINPYVGRNRHRKMLHFVGEMPIREDGCVITGITIHDGSVVVQLLHKKSLMVTYHIYENESHKGILEGILCGKPFSSEEISKIIFN